MGLASHRALRRIQRAAKRCWWLWCSASRLVEEQAFKSLAGILALAALGIVFKELLVVDKPEATTVTAAGILTVVAAFFSCFGVDLLPRLKKLGPVELFEEANALLARLVTITDQAPRGSVLLGGEGTELSLLELYHYQRADAYLSYVDLAGVKVEDARTKRKYSELLLSVGYFAHLQGAWVKAVETTRKLEEVAADYEQEERLAVMGGSYFLWAVNLPLEDRERRVLFQKAEDILQRLVRKGAASAEAYLQLAYIQDEFKKYEKSIKNNEEALREEPRLAAAKYNRAISYLKLAKTQQAYESLFAIDRNRDKSAGDVLTFARTDPELEEQLLKQQDLFWVRRIRSLLRP
jgi:tetratricopeptide (TPR) repeat protein